MDTCGYMGIHGDTWGYMWIHGDTCGYMWIYVDTCSGVERGAGGGAGTVVGARAKLDFLCALIGSQWGIQGGGSRDDHPPPPNLSRY